MRIEDDQASPTNQPQPDNAHLLAAGPSQAAAWLRRVGPIVLLAIVCLSLAVRIRQYCALPSFWYDEAYLLVNVFDKTYVELSGPLRCDQAAPPLFLWSLRWLYVWAGPYEWAMRLPAFLASLVALFVFIPLARKVAGQPGWLWAVGFCALSNHAVSHAVEVKPYAFDLLMSTILLLAASGMLTAEPRSATWRRCWAGLLGGALLGPWLSYPSVFVLGGASLALAVDAWSRKNRFTWLAWVSLNVTVLLSAAAVWYITARHQRTDSLEVYWRSAFIDLSSAGGALMWVVKYLVKVGNYGTTGLGIPLALLGLGGLIGLWQQSRALVSLLVGPLVIALVANGLRLYPLDDRLLFFAAPCLWLSAAVGVSGILGRLRGRSAWLGVIVLAALLLPGGISFAKHLVVVKPKAEFRDAFDFVLREEIPGDLWWVSHPEVAEVYFVAGRPCLSSYQPPQAVAEAARGNRLWMVACLPENGPVLQPELVQHLEAVGLRMQSRKNLRTVVVFLYAPALQP